MSQPNLNSQGQQVWDPSVGAYFTPGKENAESFGGVVAALQDQLQNQGSTVKAYPYNFAGIISAIQDLSLAVDSGPGSEIGPKPSSGDVVVDANGDPVFSYSVTPLDGTLWFDTRQGRLFIASEGEWYQTNGADGLPVITDTSTAPSASNLALGQFWYDSSTGILYIFDGRYTEANGSVVTVPTATTTPLWVQLLDAGAVPTTATLLLAGPSLPSKVTTAVTASNYLPVVDPTTITHQDDVNLYFTDALIALDTELGEQAIGMSTSPPTNPVAGELWYDTEDLELSIWYVEPGDAVADGQWVPTFSAIMQDQAIASTQASVLAETTARIMGDVNLTNSIEALTTTVASNKSTLQNSIDGVQAQVNAIPAVDFSPYITITAEQENISNLQTQIVGLVGDIQSINTNYSTAAVTTASDANLQSQINLAATKAELTTVENKIPSLDNYATQSYVGTQIAAIPTGLSANGSTLTGNLLINKEDISVPAFDFSTDTYDGRLAQKYRSNCDTTKYVTFGTNANYLEYSWDFTDCEDFCWTHSTEGKVASIDKNGIAAKKLYVSDFGTNTTYGRALLNTIDVGDRITAFEAAFVNLRTNAATATTLAELKTAIANALANV